MLYPYIVRLLFRGSSQKILLGRWGYHWEIKQLQKYYD